MSRPILMCALLPALLAACGDDAGTTPAAGPVAPFGPAALLPSPAAPGSAEPAAAGAPAAPATPSGAEVPAAPAGLAGPAAPPATGGSAPAVPAGDMPAGDMPAGDMPAGEMPAAPPADGAPIPASMVPPGAPPIGQWISLFNGENLDGWTIKMTHHPINDNYRNTFRVEDGLLRVVYADYTPPFGGEFGHLFYTGFQRIFSHYRLRIEYRIVGSQIGGAPDWGYRNNGVMIHSESPESMTLDQEFPTSMEVQFLGSDAGEASPARPTGNVCSPGTNLLLDGQLHTEHCVLTSSLVIRGEQWVTIEVEVRGNESVTHTVNGTVTTHYTNPQYDPNDGNARRLIQSTNLALSQGMIALQAESHPTDFRRVEILLLDSNAPD
jgi:Domain of Unknown Function (DUF1080)